MRLLSPRACEIKRVQFTLGRVAARLALKQIGFDNPVPILRGEKGQPLWPDGITGSITHCYPWSVAVVAKSPNHLAIGIDLESVARIKGPDVCDLVCRDVERDWARAGCHFHERLAMIFSAKEAVYKAFYPLCQRYIDFKEVELSWSPEHHRFHCRFIGALSPRILLATLCDAHCRCSGDLVFSLLTVCDEKVFAC
jgi:4'-phosphopantetheinyl transferase EntD